jgi:hypothetical protein
MKSQTLIAGSNIDHMTTSHDYDDTCHVTSYIVDVLLVITAFSGYIWVDFHI